MLWLERPPVLRWTAAALLVALAAWSEFGPSPTVEAAFLTRDIPAGTPVPPEAVERRPVPVGILDTAEPEGVAAADLQAGDPLLASMLTDVAIPTGWVVLEAGVPSHAAPGASATAIIVGDDSAPIEFPAMVVTVGDDAPFGEASGTIAVPQQWVGPAAAASSEDRLVIGVGSANR